MTTLAAGQKVKLCFKKTTPPQQEDEEENNRRMVVKCRVDLFYFFQPFPLAMTDP
jgi:hypothetical protein